MQKNEDIARPVSQEFMRRYFYENAERKMATELYEFLFWRRGKFLRPNEKGRIIEKYLEQEKEDFFLHKKINLPRLQFFVTSACSLRCRECNALIPNLSKSSAFKRNYFLSEDDFKRDLDVLSTCISSIRHFSLLGGEPLLHKNLHKLIAIALQSPIVSSIEIVTNGTVVPRGEMLEGLKHFRDHIFFRISDYSANLKLSPLLQHKKLEQVFNEHCIKFQKSSMPWFRMLTVPSQDNEQTREAFKNCYLVRCQQVFDGKLALCPKASSMDALGHALHAEEEIINLRTEPNLREAILNFYEKDFFEVCRTCGGYGEEVIPGEQLESA